VQSSPSDSALLTSRQKNIRRSLLCMSGLLFGLFFVGVMAAIFLAVHLNSNAREETTFYVTKAIEARTERLKLVVADYAFWGEAYRNVHSEVDLEWAYTRNNLGASLYESFVYEGVFVIDPNDAAVYTVINGELAPASVFAEWFYDGMDALFTDARQSASAEEVVSALVRFPDELVLVAAAGLTTGDDPSVTEVLGPRSVLLLVDRLDPIKITALGESFGINSLRVSSDVADSARHPSISLKTANSQSIVLRWDPPQPGNTMLLWLSPILISGFLAFVYITRFNLRATLAAARKADASHNETRRLQTEFEFRANHDILTGLPNRSLLEERLKQVCSLSHRSGNRFAVILLDLDGFKPINDNFSHHLGDQILIEVANRMLATVGLGDTVARMGGDEFVVVLHEVGDELSVSTMADHLLREISAPYCIESINLRVTASVGIAISSGVVETPLQLIQQADSAMYQAKGEGRNTAVWYNETISQRESEITNFRYDLQQAIDKQDFELLYQPQFNAVTGRMVGAEALLRWTHALRGSVSPATFIPVAETTGQIIPLTLWVLETACRELKELRDDGFLLPYIAVNISSTHLLRANFVSTIEAVLIKYHLNPFDLELEITESVLLNHAERAVQTLGKLKNMGVRLAIDDFGVGFSSFNYLKVLPVDKIKIDRSFIRGTDCNDQDRAICRGIISMAHHLNLRITAEGVENLGQHDFLLSIQCDDLQGYLFSKPVNIADLRSLIATQSKI